MLYNKLKNALTENKKSLIQRFKERTERVILQYIESTKDNKFPVNIRLELTYEEQVCDPEALEKGAYEVLSSGGCKNAEVIYYDGENNPLDRPAFTFKIESN